MISVPICDYCGMPIGPADEINYVTCGANVYHVGCFEDVEGLL